MIHDDRYVVVVLLSPRNFGSVARRKPGASKNIEKFSPRVDGRATLEVWIALFPWTLQIAAAAAAAANGKEGKMNEYTSQRH
jgi:hypothetical protein